MLFFWDVFGHNKNTDARTRFNFELCQHLHKISHFPDIYAPDVIAGPCWMLLMV